MEKLDFAIRSKVKVIEKKSVVWERAERIAKVLGVTPSASTIKRFLRDASRNAWEVEHAFADLKEAVDKVRNPAAFWRYRFNYWKGIDKPAEI